ncbi:MAG: hypothetical protein ONB37_13385 [candidate division KSB1 bacterium]|nr:hypothetical protein [candidate division KSB1 bacterium]
MKKLFVCFAIISVISFCRNEKNPVKPGLYDGFAIYTLADSTVTATDAAQKPLDLLSLADKPLVEDSDLEYYQWSDHTFSLRSEANERVRQLAKSRPTVFGIPFIVMANKERIYLGAFWYAFSSVAPFFPTIEVTGYMLQDYGSTVLKIKKSWVEGQPDVRNDARIYQALKKAGVLIP